MAESIADLHIALRASADKIASDIRKDVDAQKSQISANAVAIGTLISAGILAGLAGLKAAIQGAINLGMEGLDRIDALDEAATKIGITYNALQDLKYAAETTGGSFDGIVSALAKMQANLASGSGDDALGRLGLSAKNLRDLAPEKQFAEIADKLAMVKNTGDKIDLTKQIFGKGGVEILNVINGGKAGLSEMSQIVQQIGGHLTDMQRTMVNMANDDIDKLKAGWGFVKDQIAVGIAPALIMITGYINQMAKEVGGIGPLIQIWVGKAIDFLASLATVGQVLGAIVSVFQTIGSVIGAAFATAQAALTLFSETLKALGSETLNVFKSIVISIADAVATGMSSVKNGVTGTLNGIKNEAIELFNTLKVEANVLALQLAAAMNPTISADTSQAVETIRKSNEGFKGSSVIPDMSFPDLPTGEGDGGPANLLFPEGVQTVDYTGMNNAVDAYEAASVESLKVIGDAADETALKVGDIYNGNFVGDKMRKGMADAKAAMEQDARDRIAAGEAAAAQTVELAAKTEVAKVETVKAAKEVTVKIEKDAGDQIAKANKQTADQFRQTNQSAVTDMVTAWATGTGSISSIISQWASSMIRQFAQVALFGNKAGGGSIGGLIGSSAGGGAGGGAGGWASAAGAIIGGFFADGGRPPMGKVSVVGENGPELFVPDSAGRVIPNGKAASFMGSGGGGGSQTVESPIIINQSFANGVTRAELAGAMDDVIDQTTAAVAGAVSRGGGYRKRIQS